MLPAFNLRTSLKHRTGSEDGRHLRHRAGVMNISLAVNDDTGVDLILTPQIPVDSVWKLNPIRRRRSAIEHRQKTLPLKPVERKISTELFQ